MTDYTELIESLRICGAGVPLCIQAANAIEDLQDKVDRAIGFWDSKEIADAMHSLNSFMPDISDPAWQKAHMDMGFYSPLGEVYKEMGVYGETPKENEA